MGGVMFGLLIAITYIITDYQTMSIHPSHQ